MQNKTGFTLIECMITLAIISVLATSSLVLYEMPVLKTEQTAAKLELLTLADLIERYHDKYHSYLGMSFTALEYQPHTKKYDIVFASIAKDSYKIAAIPRKMSRNDPCKAFYLTEAGNKTISGEGSLEECW